MAKDRRTERWLQELNSGYIREGAVFQTRDGKLEAVGSIAELARAGELDRIPARWKR